MARLPCDAETFEPSMADGFSRPDREAPGVAASRHLGRWRRGPGRVKTGESGLIAGKSEVGARQRTRGPFRAARGLASGQPVEQSPGRRKVGRPEPLSEAAVAGGQEAPPLRDETAALPQAREAGRRPQLPGQ